MITERMRRLQESQDPSLAMNRLLTQRAMAEAIGKMAMMKGDAPIKGVDYFTPAEIEQIAQYVRSMVKDGEKGDKGDSIKGEPGIKGDTPILGVHYWTDQDKKQMAKEAAKLVKLPKSPTIDEIVASLPIAAKEPVTWDLIADAPKLTDLQGLIGFLKRGGFRGGGSSTSSSSGTNVYNEVVSGSGTAWTLAVIPTPGTVRLFANGQRLIPQAGANANDYSISGANITTVDSFTAGTLLADYSHT